MMRMHSKPGLNFATLASLVRRHVAVLLAVLSLGVFGCRTADVQPGKPQFDTDIKILEPAYAMRRPKDTPWYANMQVLLDEKPVDEKDLETKINEGKPTVRKNTEELLQEIENKIDEQRKGNERWSIISVQCGRGKKPNEIHFDAEVGLTKLYTRRPAIAISGVPMDICIAKLCRESEVQDAQPKGHNPLVNYDKQNVSAYDAIEAILKSNGFDSKYSDTSYKLTYKAQDYASRKEFVDAVTTAVLAKGQTLNGVKSALIVSPHVKDPTKTGTDTKTSTETKTADTVPVKDSKDQPKDAPKESKDNKDSKKAKVVDNSEIGTVDLPVPPPPKEKPQDKR